MTSLTAQLPYAPDIFTPRNLNTADAHFTFHALKRLLHQPRINEQVTGNACRIPQ